MKPKLQIVAKVLLGIAVLVFVSPAPIFNLNFAPGILVQIAIGGILFLIALVCWHLGDRSDQES
jgi:hypothetical protein